MKILNKMTRFIALLLIIVMQFVILLPVPKAYAATARIDLGTVDNFAILAGAAVTGTGANTVVGNVGLSPTGGTAITALTCAEVTGTIYDTNGGYTGGGGGSTACLVTDSGLLTTAKNDLSAAYTDATGRTPLPNIATDLAGATLTSGVYKSAAGTFSITGGGTVTLNGEGNADSVFIFQMASTLITSTSSKVVLTNGAQECNVYWQVGSSATIGDSSTMVGNVMAAVTITANTGSTVNGRLLADANNADADSTGAVTILNGTTITKKVCAAGTAGGAALSSSSGGSPAGNNSTTNPPNVCIATVIKAVPIIIESRRIDADSIFLSWGPYQGINTFTVRYGPTNGNWLYSTKVTGFSTTLNGLPANQSIWAEVAASDNCSIGSYGAAKLVGGPSLPNTGFAPHESNVPWGILAVILVGASALPVLIKRKRFSSKS